MWESLDAGRSVHEFTTHDTGVYFVMIDRKGWLYSATQAGAFVSQDKGATWNPYHVMINTKSGRFIDRVPHDYQRIVPDFRGDQIAFPSDQGLHIVKQESGNFNLTSAVGDMHNAMSLSALIAPSLDGKSRNIVSNIWDWDVAASWDDGATWAGWAPGESSPSWCGEGGGGTSMGTSGKMIMTHHNHWAFSDDGGYILRRESCSTDIPPSSSTDQSIPLALGTTGLVKTLLVPLAPASPTCERRGRGLSPQVLFFPTPSRLLCLSVLVSDNTCF